MNKRMKSTFNAREFYDFAKGRVVFCAVLQPIGVILKLESKSLMKVFNPLNSGCRPSFTTCLTSKQRDVLCPSSLWTCS